MIIGISGSMSVGKSTVANHLLLNHGFHTELAFATHLKELIAKFYGVDKRLLFAPIKTPQIREQMQTTSELIKFLRGKDYFVKYLLDEIDHYQALEEHVIVSDARFFNELQALEEFGAHLIRIERPGLDTSGKLHQHESETSAWGYWEIRRQANRDCVIVNDSTVADLLLQVDDWVTSIL